MQISALNRRRWHNFRANKRAYWSLVIFSICFFISLLAELIANDKPILVKYRGEYFFPIANFYPETAFGGDFKTEAVYRDPEVKFLIISGGLEECFESPEEIMEAISDASFDFTTPSFEQGYSLWPIIPYSYNTPVDRPGAAPLLSQVHSVTCATKQQHREKSDAAKHLSATNSCGYCSG